MPELPEVETVRLSLERLILGLPIKRYEVMRDDFVQHGLAHARALNGAVIEKVARRGKFIALFTSIDMILVHHLGMSGRMLFVDRSATLEPHTHIRIRFENQPLELRQRDPRRFGFCAIFTAAEFDRYTAWSQLGPDALEISSKRFHLALEGRSAPLKSLLLNQRIVAGLGNIYVDEGLFRARLHPLSPAGMLSYDESKRLLRHLKQVLRESIAAGGSTTNDFQRLDGRLGEFQHAHRVYQKHGQPCPRCRTSIAKIVLGGRGTHYCPECQELHEE